MSNSAVSTSWMRPKLWLTLDADHAAVDVDHLPPGRLSIVVPQKGGFSCRPLMATLPPITAGVGRGGVDREDQACGGRGLLDAAGDAARAAFNHGMLALDARQAAHDGTAVVVELLHVDHGRVGVQRNGAARVARAARARNDGELELEERAHEGRDLLLAVGREDDERILDAPVGGVGDVRDARKAVEADVVRIGDRGQTALHFDTALDELREAVVEAAHGGARLGSRRSTSALPSARWRTASRRQLIAHEQFVALRVHDQVVDQIGIALDRPDVAEHFNMCGETAKETQSCPRPFRPGDGSQSRGPRATCSYRESRERARERSSRSSGGNSVGEAGSASGANRIEWQGILSF